jgi:hypothetical protein
MPDDPSSLPSSPKSTSNQSLRPLDDVSITDETNSHSPVPELSGFNVDRRCARCDSKPSVTCFRLSSAEAGNRRFRITPRTTPVNIEAA